NHIHGIIAIVEKPAETSASDNGPASNEYPVRSGHPKGTLLGTIGRIIQAFKSISTHEYTIEVKERGWAPFQGKLWQRNYYERIIRSEEILDRARRYILNNPARWRVDEDNPDSDVR